MPDFGIFRGFNDKLFGDKLYAGQLPINLGLIGSSNFGFDVDAQAFFDRVTAAGGTLSSSEKLAIDTLVKQMKLDGIWTKMKAIYPMVGASAAACAQNLKSSSFTGTFNGGWTFASTGVLPNGSTGYMNTGLIPNVDLQQNSSHLSVYIRGTNTDNQIYIGGRGTSITILNYILNFGFIAINNGDTPTTIDRGQGLYINSRTSSTNLLRVKNGVVGNTLTVTSTGLHERPLWLGAYNNDNSILFPSKNENAFASIGDGLDATEASNFYTAVQAFQTTLFRNV
jgi:hypothetical protein